MTGTDKQAEGPINFHIHEGLCKLFFGVYMIMAFDPSVLFNEGFYDLFDVVLPEGSLLNPAFPGRAVEPPQHPYALLRLPGRRARPARPAPLDGRRLRHEPALHLHRPRPRTANISS